MEALFVPGRPRLALSVAGSGRLVLFLHGIGGNRNHWQEQVYFFSRRFRAAAWDARGYGESDDYEGELRFDDFTDDVLRTVDFLKSPKTHVVGLSMGGRIARNFALKHPERVQTLTLVNSSPGFDALSPEEVLKFVEERRNRSPDSLRRLLGSRPRPGAHEALLNSFKALHNDSYAKTIAASVAQDRAAPIEEIAAPTLVVAGDEDRLYPPELARRMAERIPNARLVMLESCGHMSNLEQPERFNAALLEFLESHP